MCAGKLLILAREAGFELDSADIELENLVPVALRKVSADQFMDRLKELDDPILTAFGGRAGSARCCATSPASSTTAKAPRRAGDAGAPPPFANLLPCDNVFAIESDSYRTNPGHPGPGQVAR